MKVLLSNLIDQKGYNSIYYIITMYIHEAKKKICVFMVTRPTLIFASDPMNFYTEFG